MLKPLNNEIGPQHVLWREICIIYGRKFPKNDPNNAKTDFSFLETFFALFVQLLSYFLVWKGLKNSAITYPGIQLAFLKI